MSIDNSDQVALLFRQVYQRVVDETGFIEDVDLVLPPVELSAPNEQRWWHRPVVAVGGAALAVLIAVGSVALLPIGGTDKGRDIAAGIDAPRYPAIDNIELILGPGAELTRSSTSLFSGDAPPSSMVAWAREGDDGFDIAVVYLKAPIGGELARGYAGLEGDQAVIVGPDGSTFTATSATPSTPAGVGWSDQGEEFLVMGIGVDTDALLDEAEKLAGGEPLPSIWNDELPQVYEGSPILGPPNGVEMREATYQSQDGRRQIDVTSFDRWPHVELATLLRTPNARITHIDGVEAIIVSDTGVNEGDASRYVLWTGSDGVVNGVTGLGLNEDELIATAGRLVDRRADYVDANEGSFELGYERVGEPSVLMAGDDWKYMGQEVIDDNKSGVCSWVVIDGGAKQESTQCDFPDGSNGTQFGNIARVAAGTLVVGSANNISAVELTLEDGTSVQLETATFPGNDEPTYFAYVVPWGSRADVISLHDATGRVVFTAPVE